MRIICQKKKRRRGKSRQRRWRYLDLIFYSSWLSMATINTNCLAIRIVFLSRVLVSFGHQTEDWTDRQTGQTDRLDRQTDWTDRQTDRQTDWTDRQTRARQTCLFLYYTLQPITRQKRLRLLDCITLDLPIVRSTYVALILVTTGFSKAWHNS